jgi:hypothetical protein
MKYQSSSYKKNNKYVNYSFLNKVTHVFFLLELGKLCDTKCIILIKSAIILSFLLINRDDFIFFCFFFIKYNLEFSFIKQYR